MLESWASDRGVREVTFAGWAPEMASELSRAGVLLASALAEPFGLSVVEAMAAGVPVVATAAGGHLETLGSLPSAPLFLPGDADAAARLLRSMMQDEARARVSTEGRERTASSFTISSHVERLLAVYESVSAATRAR
jgi:glycosyltransferase involved in cell wall biosynthesis